MKHLVTITTDDFQNNDYSDNLNCPLAQALKRTFNATEVWVGVDYFIMTHPKYGFIQRSFQACKVESCDYIVTGFNSEDYLENAICEMSTWNQEHACDLTFNFMTHH